MGACWDIGAQLSPGIAGEAAVPTAYLGGIPHTWGMLAGDWAVLGQALAGFDFPDALRGPIAHMLPGVRDVPNHLASLFPQSTSCHELSGKPKYMAPGGLDQKENPDPWSAVGALLVRSSAPPRNIARL